MGVYIKGMEMPKSCLECRLYNDPWCMAKNRNQWRTAYNRPPKGERQNDCPLVPVPPHERLIDADALRAKQQEDADLFINAVSLAEKSRRDEALNAVANIVNAPTIIPASEEEVK